MATGGEGKLPGKATWAGRRRPVTRRAGFSARAGVQVRAVGVGGYQLRIGDVVEFTFTFPQLAIGDWAGFGGWYSASNDVEVEVHGSSTPILLVPSTHANWGKFGGLHRTDRTDYGPVVVRFTAHEDAVLAVWDVLGGRVEHPYLDDAREELLTNMWRFAPEANFYDPSAQATIHLSNGGAKKLTSAATIHLKSCNRCGRFLPINLADERRQLSFSNHCVAPHRRPCRHAGFGRLQDAETGEVLELDYGFQLECRFCKKFEVNAAHNPQRTAAQMKEDGARRRAFELLLEHLYEGTPQLRYRALNGTELANDVWERFGRACFKCGTPLASPRDMHLDHTRPLALLWPLDGTATALCATHNSEKRDRPPSEFYTADELERLSEITGIPLVELQDPSPNLAAIATLRERLKWFAREFLTMPDLSETRDGKDTADLLVKAIQKALEACPGGAPFNLATELKLFR